MILMWFNDLSERPDQTSTVCPQIIEILPPFGLKCAAMTTLCLREILLPKYKESE